VTSMLTHDGRNSSASLFGARQSPGTRIRDHVGAPPPLLFLYDDEAIGPALLVIAFGKNAIAKNKNHTLNRVSPAARIICRRNWAWPRETRHGALLTVRTCGSVVVEQ